MNQQQSDKIKVFTFVNMIMVLFIHSYNVPLYQNNISDNDWLFSKYIQDFISFHICRVAVPFFFIISGFLFLYNVNFSFYQYFFKLRKRLKTLFIPYISWVLIWTFSFWIASQFPFLKNYINKPNNEYFLSLSSVFKLFKEPICYQFWFIRDLIILVLLSPVIFFFLKKIPILFLFALFLNFVYFNFSIGTFQLQSIFYFTIGMYIALLPYEYKLFIEKLNVYFLGFIWISSYGLNLLNYGNLFVPFSVLIGILFLWLTYERINIKSKMHTFLLKWSGFSFFLFAIHEPLQVTLKKIGFSVLGFQHKTGLILYFIIPIVVIFISMLIGYNFKKYFSRTYYLLTGGR